MKADLLKYRDRLKIKNLESGNLIWDLIRKKYLVLTPEELVRQLCLSFLINQGQYPKEKINVEKGLLISGRQYRYDLLVYNSKLQPFLLVECKAPSVKLTDLTFQQISNYNRELKVPYLLITNGPQLSIVHINWDTKTFEFLNDLPAYQ